MKIKTVSGASSLQHYLLPPSPPAASCVRTLTSPALWIYPHGFTPQQFPIKKHFEGILGNFLPGCPNSVKFDGLVVPRRLHSHVHVNIFVSLSNRWVSKRRPRTSPQRLAQRSSHAAIFSPASSGRADWPTQLWSSGHDVRVSPQVGLRHGQEVWSKAGVSSLESVGEESRGEGAGLPVAFQLVSTPTPSLSPDSDSKFDSENKSFPKLWYLRTSRPGCFLLLRAP